MSTNKNNNNCVIPYYRALVRPEEYVQAKKLKDIYWMIDYRLPCDIARKICRDYLFPRDIIQTIEQVEEDDFWTLHYLWQENGVVGYLKPEGASRKYRIHDFSNLHLRIFI